MVGMGVGAAGWYAEWGSNQAEITSTNDPWHQSNRAIAFTTPDRHSDQDSQTIPALPMINIDTVPGSPSGQVRVHIPINSLENSGIHEENCCIV